MESTRGVGFKGGGEGEWGVQGEYPSIGCRGGGGRMGSVAGRSILCV